MLSVEDWAEIRKLHRTEGCRSKCSPGRWASRAARCVRRWRPTGHRSTCGSRRDPRSMCSSRGSVSNVKRCQHLPASVIAERVCWDRGMTVFKQRVAELRPACLPPDPASGTTCEAGDLAQFDFWFPDIELPVGSGQTRTAKRVPVMTTVTGYSRWGRRHLDPIAGSRGSVRGLVAPAVDPSSPATARRSAASWVGVCTSASPPSLKPRGCSSGCMTTSRGFP